MDVIVGSLNQAKVRAVKEVFPEAHVIKKDIASGVSAQPFSDEETKEGAIHRAIGSLKNAPKKSIGIGLEGGVMYMEDGLYLCNWGALVTRERTLFTASGARIKLPKLVQQKLEAGLELGEIMEEYTDLKNVRQREGAIGILTKGFVDRKALFVHIVQLLRGQWEHGQTTKKAADL